MMHGTYVGPREHLRGNAALLLRDGADYLLAQFDDRNLALEEENTPAQSAAQSLGFGWHRFDVGNFNITRSETKEA